MNIGEATLLARSGPSTESNLNYSAAEAIGTKLGFDVFVCGQSEEISFRETLARLIPLIRPGWFRLVPYGRLNVIRSLNNNEVQCFEIANLTETYDPESVRWWDELATVARLFDSETAEQGWREAERRSLAVEEALLADQGMSSKPEWTAIEDNLAGFDIKSYRWGSPERTQFQPHYIEVKSSVTEQAFILSRREWSFATRQSHRWELHFWQLSSNTLRVLSYDEVLQNIPTEQGTGIWRDVVVKI